MKRTIYDCWKCRHHNSDNPYGIDYCEVHDTRCSFAHDDCDNFEPINDGNERHTEPPRRLSVIIWYLEIIAVAAILGWLLMGCTTTKYVTVPEVHEHWHHSTDTIHQTDSIIDHQTTTIREVDSATMAQYGIQMKNMQRAWLIETNRLQRELSELRQTRADTIHERDSIPYPVEVTKEVPSPLTWWQQARMHVGGIVIFLLIIFVVWKIYVTLHPRL
jgi:hypothetical protein